MFRSEVEEWLYSIGLQELYVYFEQDGFVTLDAVRQMRQSDIDAIVDRNGIMIILNEEIDKLNYGDSVFSRNSNNYDRSSREASYISEPVYETRESLISRYENRGIPAVGFASRNLARRAKSQTRRTRGASVATFGYRSSVERYIPNSASDAYERLFESKRAASVAAASARQVESSAAATQILDRQRRREEERSRRARTGNYTTTKIIHKFIIFI